MNGDVYDTEIIPAVKEVTDDTGKILVEAQEEMIVEKKETPASVDNGKPMPVVVQMVSILKKRVKAQDLIIASLVKRLDEAGL